MIKKKEMRMKKIKKKVNKNIKFGYFCCIMNLIILNKVKKKIFNKIINSK